MARNQVIVSITSNIKGLQKGVQDSQGLLGKLGGVAGVATKAIVGVGAALGGIAIAGGFARALKLDEATTKLQALNYTTGQTEEITKSALASVKGTAYGLDSAVNSAVGLLAAGIKPGEQLTGVLKTIANTAALAGTSMDEMGSIFNKVAANGKVTTMEMNQLADRGVPIWQYLGESLGVNNSELRKMIEAGSVTADMFNNALGPAVEGVAATMGGSFKGMLSNAYAALGRLGAMFAGPIIESGKAVLGEFTTLVDGIASLLAPVVEKFNGVLDGISFEGLADRVLASFEGLSDLSPAAIVLKLVSGIATAITKNAPKVADALVSMIGNMIDLLITSVPVILEAAIILLGAIVQAIPLIIPRLVTGIVQLLPVLLTSLVAMIPALIEGAISLFTSIVQALVTVVPVIISALVDLLPMLLKTVVDMIPVLLDAAISLFTALIEALPIILPLLLKALIDLLPKIIVTIIQMVPKLLMAAIDLFIALVEAIPKIVPDLIEAVIRLLPEIIGALIGMVPSLLQAGIDLIGGLVSGLWRAAGAVGKALLDIIGGAVQGFLQFLGIASPSKVFSGFGKNVVQGLVKGLDGSKNLVNKSMDKLSDLVTDGFDATLTAPEMRLAVAGGGRSTMPTGNVYNVELHTLNATAETGRVIVESIRDYESAGGRL